MGIGVNSRGDTLKLGVFVHGLTRKGQHNSNNKKNLCLKRQIIDYFGKNLMRTLAHRPFPRTLPEPESYYHGVDHPDRPQTGNVLVFLRTRRSSLQRRDFANRSHHRHVLMLVLDTAGSVIVDGHEIPLHEGQGLLVRPFQFHHYVRLEQDALRWLFVTFDLKAGGGRLPELDGRSLDPDEDSLTLWSRIARDWATDELPRRVAVIPLLDRLLMQLTGTQSDARHLKSAPTSWVARAESLLIEAIHRGWTVDEIARRLGLSERRLRTRFEEQTGVSMRRYRANYQLHRAMELMSGSSLSMGQIAERCGFHSLPVFTRFIRRETGLTPSELKQSLLGSGA